MSVGTFLCTALCKILSCTHWCGSFSVPGELHCASWLFGFEILLHAASPNIARTLLARRREALCSVPTLLRGPRIKLFQPLRAATAPSCGIFVNECLIPTTLSIPVYTQCIFLLCVSWILTHSHIMHKNPRHYTNAQTGSRLYPV